MHLEHHAHRIWNIFLFNKSLMFIKGNSIQHFSSNHNGLPYLHPTHCVIATMQPIVSFCGSNFAVARLLEQTRHLFVSVRRTSSVYSVLECRTRSFVPETIGEYTRPTGRILLMPAITHLIASTGWWKIDRHTRSRCTWWHSKGNYRGLPR